MCGCHTCTKPPFFMKRLLQILGTLILFVVVYLASSLTVGAVVGSFDAPSTDMRFMMINLAVVVMVFVLLTVVERLLWSRREGVMIALRGFDPVAVLWGVIFLVSVYVVTSPLESLLAADNRVFPDGGWTLILAVGIAPMFEELIFRGRLVSMLRHFASPSLAVVLSALLFAVAHGSLIVAIDAFIAGIILGYFYYLKGSIITPIILHICNNAIAYAMMQLSYHDKSIQELIVGSENYFVIYAVALVVVVVGFGHLVRTMRRVDRRSHQPEVNLEEEEQPSELVDDEEME